MANRTNNQLLAQLARDVGDIKGQMGQVVERSEENSRKLDELGRDLTRRLDHHSGRLRTLERAANTGKGALKALLWVGGALVTLAGLAVAAGKLAVQAARAMGKG